MSTKNAKKNNSKKRTKKIDSVRIVELENSHLLPPKAVNFNENTTKIELESFSIKNSEAKYHKNLQFRDKLPK